MSERPDHSGDGTVDRSVLQQSVREVMTRPVRTVEYDLSVAAASKILVGDEIGALVVVEDDAIEGIVTETDVVETVAAGHDTDRLTVRRLMTPDVVTVEASATVETACDRMRVEDVKKLPVTEDGSLVGIVTTTDVTHSLVPDLDDIVVAFQ